MAVPLTDLGPLLPALRRRPFALLTDVDGTISTLAPTPEQARVSSRSRALLRQLSEQVVVGVVSGRDVPDLQRMIDLPDLVYVGLHGLAYRVDGMDEFSPEGRPYQLYTREAAAELSHLKRIDNLIIEVKTVGLAIHYRNVRRAGSARFEILRALASSAAASKFEVHEAIRAIELRPPIGVTKGVALRRLAERFGLQGILYLGDDRTDVDAFSEARRMRDRLSLLAYSVAVVHAEALQSVAAAADFTVDGVEGAEWLLGELAGFFESTHAETA